MKASRLKCNNTIGVCAPSGCIKEKNKEELQCAENYLNEFNLNVKYGENLYANSCIYSASVEEKIKDINNLINDKNVNSIAFAKGGNNVNSILEYIDYDGIKKILKYFFDLVIIQFY